MLTEELIKAYYATTYDAEVDGEIINFRAGVHNRKIDEFTLAVDASEWAFVSACNPYSQLLTDEENLKRHQLLKNVLEMHGCEYFEGGGIADEGEWPREQGLLSIGLSLKQAIEVGQIFQQNAIMFCSVGDVAKVISCST